MKFLVFSGSLREGSWNTKLARLAQAELERLGHLVDFFDLRAAQFPLYDEALLGKVPAVLDFKARLQAADGVVIASPEYNYSITGVLKNALDWASRPPASNPFKGKWVAQVGATPGPGGTLLGQMHLRHVLSQGLSAHVVPGPAFTLSKAPDVFTADGTLPEDQQQKLSAYLARLIAELKARTS